MVWSLLAAVEQGRARAELDARQGARELARSLQAQLGAAAVLERAPAAARFSVRGGELQVDEQVGWLRGQPALPQDPVVADKLRQAQLSEFARGDAAAAASQYDELLGPRGPQAEARLPVLAAAAFAALRAGDAPRAGELHAALDASLASLPPSALAQPVLAGSAAASALLATALRRPCAESTHRLLPSLPPALAQPLVARLCERGADATALAAAAADVAARRALLAQVATLLPQLGAEPIAAAAADQLLLWIPEQAGSGDGALLPPAFVQQLQPAGGRGVLCFADPPADAEPVVAELVWAAPEPLPPPSLLARPAAVLAATALLVLVFAASAAFAVRALRREALAMRARAEFLTGVTHELKTPVAAIRLVAEVLHDDEVAADRQREYFGLLASESARLSMLIDNVLDLGQMERGERAYDPRPGDAAATVREAVALFAPLAQRSGLAVSLHEETAAAPATLDAGAVTQALLNVLDNARKYAAGGGRIEVTTHRDHGTFAVTVRDFGPGVPAAERAAIFGRFARGSAHRHGSIPGVGLGLHLARAIALRHGGDLVAGAPPAGAGAVFTLTLPLDPEAA